MVPKLSRAHAPCPTPCQCDCPVCGVQAPKRRHKSSDDDDDESESDSSSSSPPDSGSDFADDSDDDFGAAKKGKAAKTSAAGPRGKASTSLGGAPSKAGGSSAAKAGEALKFKSPAEFFAEHQNIAGFDNVGARGVLARGIVACRCASQACVWLRGVLGLFVAGGQGHVHHRAGVCGERAGCTYF